MVVFVERENIGAGISFSRAIAGGLLARAYFGSAFLYSLFFKNNNNNSENGNNFFACETLTLVICLDMRGKMGGEEIKRKKNEEKRK